MGREERFPSTGFLPAHACWSCYGLVLLVTALILRAQPTQNAWRDGLVAALVTTFIVFGFALAYRNSSIYDPYWCWFPLFAGTCWAMSGAWTWRSCYTLGLLALWVLRYNLQWPWEGWRHGLRTEDWRYPLMARKLGLQDSTGVVYWTVVSLTGAHVVPTLLVWFVLAPAIKVWTADAADVALLDLLAVLIGLSGIILQYISDRTLYLFRAQVLNAKGLETQSCPKTCRLGPWAWSRHPNYLGEVTFWLGMSIAAYAAGDVHWMDVAGMVNYACFFRVSASLMDRRSLGHRSGFREVMEETNALMPMPLVLDQFIDRLLIPELSL